MQRLLAIAFLTVKAAFRYRLVVVLGLLLLGAVVAVPMVIKHDGSARGLTQIVMTYTLSAITGLLGFATLWLACGTLARDVEECQMQMVAVKPISRWQIWVGKWTGIMILNTLLLGLSAGAVYVLMQWRAQKLPQDQQEILRNEVLVARGSLKEPQEDIRADVEKILQEKLKETSATGLDVQLLRKQIEEQLKAQFQLVPPGYMRRWRVDLGVRKNFLKDQPFYLRIKFHSPETKDVTDPLFTTPYLAVWEVGPPETDKRVRREMSLAPAAFHEFAVPPNLWDENGFLTIDFQNRNNVALFFPLEEPLEVLYREGGFGMNFLRGVGIIFCWLALLAAIGLFAASFLSFPVAAFVALSILLVGFSSGTLAGVVSEGSFMGIDYNTGEAYNPIIDSVAVPIFRGLLKVVNLAKGFSPIDSLSSGRSIPWEQLARAVAQICLLLGGLFGAFGIVAFTRRELATAQGQN